MQEKTSISELIRFASLQHSYGANVKNNKLEDN